MAIDRPAFGARVRVGAVLKRMNSLNGGRTWVPSRFSSKRAALYIGYRTLYDGKRVWEGSEEGYVFYPETHFQAALVVFSERTNPVLVPFDALEVIHNGQKA